MTPHSTPSRRMQWNMARSPGQGAGPGGEARGPGGQGARGPGVRGWRLMSPQSLQSLHGHSKSRTGAALKESTASTESTESTEAPRPPKVQNTSVTGNLWPISKSRTHGDLDTKEGRGGRGGRGVITTATAAPCPLVPIECREYLECRESSGAWGQDDGVRDAPYLLVPRVPRVPRVSGASGQDGGVGDAPYLPVPKVLRFAETLCSFIGRAVV